MNTDVIVQNDPKQSDKASLAAEESKQNKLPIIIMTDDPASDSKTLAPPFNFPAPKDTIVEDPPMTVNGQVIRTLYYGISIAGTTLTPGAPPITISNTPISYGPSLLAVGSTTTALAVNDPKSPTTNIAGQVFTIKPNAVEIAGATLTPEAPAVTVSGTPVSLGPSALVIGTNTIPFQTQPADPFITNVASYPVTAAPDAVELAGTTLHPGDPGVELDGTVVSLDVGGGHLIVGSKTIVLTASGGRFGDPAALGIIADPFVTTIGNQAITAAPTAVAFGGTTLLTPGAPGKTINGTLISLNTAGQLVVGTKTVPFETSSAGLGRLIMGGFGDGGPLIGTSSSSPIAGSSSNGTSSNGTVNTDGAVFLGEAESLRKSSFLFWTPVAVSAVAMYASVCFNWW